jgi:hypothetical protein
MKTGCLRAIKCPEHQGGLVAFGQYDDVDPMNLRQIGDQAGQRLSIDVPEQEFGDRQKANLTQCATAPSLDP